MKKIILILCAAGMVTGAMAQRKLTYEEAVAIALQKNLDYNTQKNEMDRSTSQKWQSIMDLGPSLRFNADIFDRRGRQQIQNPETNQVEFLDVVSDNIQMSLNASMPLFGGLNRIQTYRSNQSSFKAQEYSVERSKQTTIFNVAQQYLQVLLSEELYRIAADNHRNQSEILRRIEGQVAVGALAPVDKFNQLAEVKRLETLVIRSKNTFENDKLVLAQTLQLEPGTDFELVNPSNSLDEILALSINVEELYQTALSSRPDYAQQKELVLSNTRRVNALRGNYFPTVSAFYIYGSSYNSRVPFTRTEQLTDVNPYHFYGFSLGFPILGGFSTRNRVQSAKIDRDNSLLQESNLKTIIYRDVKTAHQNFEAAKASYRAAVVQLEAATEAYTLEKQRYELGLSAFFEFSQANNALILAQGSRAQAAFTLMFQETILNYQVGQLKEAE